MMLTGIDGAGVSSLEPLARILLNLYPDAGGVSGGKTIETTGLLRATRWRGLVTRVLGLTYPITRFRQRVTAITHCGVTVWGDTVAPFFFTGACGRTGPRVDRSRSGPGPA